MSKFCKDPWGEDFSWEARWAQRASEGQRKSKSTPRGSHTRSVVDVSSRPDDIQLAHDVLNRSTSWHYSQESCTNSRGDQLAPALAELD